MGKREKQAQKDAARWGDVDKALRLIKTLNKDKKAEGEEKTDEEVPASAANEPLPQEEKEEPQEQSETVEDAVEPATGETPESEEDTQEMLEELPKACDVRL